MEEIEFEKYLSDRYETAVQWYNNKANENKRIYYFLHISTIIVAAITPVFAILEFKWITVIAASLVAITTGVIKFIKVEEN